MDDGSTARRGGRAALLVIFNPIAGRRRAALLWQVLDLLAGNAIRVEIARTRHRGHATELAAAAAAAGRALVVAAGGDGTIAEVAQGLAGSTSALGIIPLGTANVLAHELGLPAQPRAIAASLAFRRTRDLLPGLARSTGPGAGPPRQFVQMLGAGFDARVVHHLSPTLKRLLGQGAYAVQGARELARGTGPTLALRLDGAPVEAASAIICKGRLYGGNHLLAAGADHARPGFIVALFAHGGALPTALCGLALPLGLLPRVPGLVLRRASHIEILNGAEVKLQADGDAAGTGPVLITDAPAPIPLVVPR